MSATEVFATSPFQVAEISVGASWERLQAAVLAADSSVAAFHFHMSNRRLLLPAPNASNSNTTKIDDFGSPFDPISVMHELAMCCWSGDCPRPQSLS